MATPHDIKVKLTDLLPDSRRMFRAFVSEYAISDLGGQRILHSGLRALEQAEAAEATVATDGTVFKDRFGQPRAHPLLAVARDFRAQFISALGKLNLAVGDAPKVGRPEGA